jgi:hypothetical protein
VFALESAHAAAAALDVAQNMQKDEAVIVHMSGRGDKDLFITAKHLDAGPWQRFLSEEASLIAGESGALNAEEASAPPAGDVGALGAPEVAAPGTGEIDPSATSEKPTPTDKGNGPLSMAEEPSLSAPTGNRRSSLKPGNGESEPACTTETDSTFAGVSGEGEA